jgi:hypothetical protein
LIFLFLNNILQLCQIIISPKSRPVGQLFWLKRDAAIIGLSAIPTGVPTALLVIYFISRKILKSREILKK